MQKYFKNFNRAPITCSLIVICIVVYMISFVLFGVEMSGQEGIMFGGYNPVFVYVNHEYYRFITANFIHFGLFHILVNCYSLYGIGMFIELSLKKKRYVVVVLCSMISTTLLPYLLFLINGFEMYTVSGGISGVIFGLIGSLGALALKYGNIFQDVFKQLAPQLIFMLLLSVLVPTISLSGHVCGLIGGFVSTYIILNHPFKKKNDYSDLLN